MANDHLPPFIQHLLQPDAHSLPIPDLKLVQTHISYVILAGSQVYKFKKPVDFGFLNFTTLEKRRYFCEQELLLNRRLCPELYLGLVSVTEENETLRLNDPARDDDRSHQVIEYGVKMARMPEDRMMANLIKAGLLTREMLATVCDTLVPFYAKADCGPEIKKFGTAAAVSVNILENFDQTREFAGSTVLPKSRFDLIERAARSFLERTDLFESRLAAGRVRDCHGDLYSANICLADKVYIYDCIEFNQRFRYCDVASDVAFLAMDLDFHGLRELSHYFIDRFTKAAQDPGLTAMLNFYKCYRAVVRGKIGLFTARAPEVDEQTRQHALVQAGKYFALAEEYAGL